MFNYARRQGFTLVEMMMVLAIAAILMVAGAPTFFSAIERARLKGVAENLYTRLLFAKSAAIKEGQEVFFSAQSSNGGAQWCYGLGHSAGCDCATAGACDVLSASQAQASGVLMSYTLDNGRTSFLPRNGLPSTSGDLIFTDPDGESVRVTVRPIGRIGMCSDDVAGYGGCS